MTPNPRRGGLSETSATDAQLSVSFSARTGNIYTALLVPSMGRLGTGGTHAADLSWSRARPRDFHDPFRPTIEPGGFASVPEMLAAREGTIAAFRPSDPWGCNVLVFTLGLTGKLARPRTGRRIPDPVRALWAGSFDPDLACLRKPALRGGLHQPRTGDPQDPDRTGRAAGRGILLTVSAGAADRDHVGRPRPRGQQRNRKRCCARGGRRGCAGLCPMSAIFSGLRDHPRPPPFRGASLRAEHAQRGTRAGVRTC